ncbi:MAG: Gfo/Idh/MocA family oxidoreductase [Candidatus Hydrogenedentes bacterium]|nr:Gfo/Idh/MocA family oxidoreductase [Candidatus Hydrogenedentota bacterium]
MANDRECRADIAQETLAPELPYLPSNPAAYNPNIGLIGCGGIAPYHLRAYKKAGYRVVALCDRAPAKAESLRAEHFPDARVSADYRDIVQCDEIEVVDVATHPPERVAIIEDALRARKHVLSQKPFVLDLDVGERLADLADTNGVLLAVNQNGRWAPHFAYIREAIRAGMLGEVTGANLSVHWDHNWTADTPFDQLRHLILYDFAIHWFDIVTCFMGDKEPTRVFASAARSAHQRATPPLLAKVTIEYDDGLASLAFNADTRYGAQDQTIVVGRHGTAVSVGPDLNTQSVTVTTDAGRATPALEGDWFTNGFHGTMAELLCAIEQGRQPYNSARHNLRSVALCFAAIHSADTGLPVVPGTARRIEP